MEDPKVPATNMQDGPQRDPSPDPQSDSFLRQLKSDLNDPNAGPALAAALEAIQDLAAEDLAAEEMHNIRARTGPRNADEALVRAARQLLAVPITPPPPPEPPKSPVRRGAVSAR